MVNLMLEGFRNRLLLMALACIMALGLMLPAFAFADDYEGGGGGSHSFGGSYPTWGTVWYGPTIDGDDNCYGVVAYTNWDAALFCLGYNDGTDDFSVLFTPAKKAKLVKSGNAFYDFAQGFRTGKPELSDNLFFNNDYAFVSAWNSARDLYGETYCYSSRYSSTAETRAKAYVQQVLNETEGGGGSGGGGSGGGGTSDDLQTSIPLYYMGNGEEFAGDQPTLVVLQSLLDSLSQSMIDNNLPYWAITVNENNGDLNIWLAESDFQLYLENDVLKYFTFDNKVILKNYRFAKSKYAVNDNEIELSSASLPNGLYGHNLTYNSDIGKYVYDTSNVGYCTDKSRTSGGGGDDPVEPPTVWPDPPTPVTPNPPEVPTPPDPTPPDPPDPTPPDPPTPWVPIPGPDDDPITGEDFQDLLDALAEHCQHIRDAMSDNFEQLWTNQSELLVSEFASTRDTLTDNLQWLGNDIIAQGFTDLSAYLNDLFEWLAEQMEYNVNVDTNQYDDSSIIYWLKRIWSKLGTGDINVRPTDPVTDNEGWWEWLLQLMDNFVSFLLGFGLDKLGDVGSALQALTGKFPFSLPWDLAALFGLLVAPPQTPAVDFPCYTVSLDGIQQVGTYHLSLADYNNAWEQVRWLERVSFCILLIKSSDFFTSLLGKVFGK